MRWPVLDTGRNSVSPSTMPRTSASRRFFSQESRDTGPIVRRVVGAVVARAFEADPLLRPAPHIVEAPSVLGRDDLILGGDDTQKPGFHLGRVGGRIETVLQEPVHRQRSEEHTSELQSPCNL